MLYMTLGSHCKQFPKIKTVAVKIFSTSVQRELNDMVIRPPKEVDLQPVSCNGLMATWVDCCLFRDCQ